MSKFSIMAAVAGLAITVSGAAAQTPAPAAPDQQATINQRLENQKDRVQAGTKDDQLTKGERTQLKADDAAIQARERVDRQAHDGKLTPAERQQLNRDLNRTSRQIHRDRTNNRKPKS